MRLIAVDSSDLQTIAAAVQDALFLAQNITYSASNRTLTIEINRFIWENDDTNQRVRAVLSFSSVMKVMVSGVDKNSNIPKSILSIDFIADKEPPGGNIIIELAGGGKIAIVVECIDAIIGDIGVANDVKNRPNHDKN